MSLMMKAATNGHKKVVKVLMDAGADLNEMNEVSHSLNITHNDESIILLMSWYCRMVCQQ